MEASTYVMLSGALSFGVPIAFAVRELLVLRLGGGGWREPDEPTIPPVPHAPDFTPDPLGKKLPDCLIPKPLVRLPELVD